MRAFLVLVLVFLTYSVSALVGGTFKQVNSATPSELRTRLIKYLGQKRQMDVVSATKEGQWILIGRGVHYYSSGSFFDRMTGNGLFSNFFSNCLNSRHL